jgi:hypothetical protein
MTTETLQLPIINIETKQLSPEELEQDRQDIIEQAIAARSINLSTLRPSYNFGDPIEALARAKSRANND